jgi:hypothetical protein
MDTTELINEQQKIINALQKQIDTLQRENLKLGAQVYAFRNVSDSSEDEDEYVNPHGAGKCHCKRGTMEFVRHHMTPRKRGRENVKRRAFM